MIKKEYQLLLPFVKEPWKNFTFKNIKKLCNKSSESYVFGVLKKFVKQGILHEEKAGNTVLYCLNISDLKAQVYAGFVAEHAAWSIKLPFSEIKKIAEKIPAAHYSFLISGSYANGKQKPNSDIDIVVICDDGRNAAQILSEIRWTCELTIPPGHPYVFRKSEFLEMLANDEANYGKEIAKNNLILFGGAAYYRMISEAMKHGFNDTKLH